MHERADDIFGKMLRIESDSSDDEDSVVKDSCEKYD